MKCGSTTLRRSRLDRCNSWRQKRSAGFTIIEVLIVFAISAGMFVAALALINGRQRQTAFNQATRNFQTEMQQLASDVGSGFYQSDGNIQCANTGLTSLSTGATNLGTNADCIFLGKAMQFGILGTDPQEYVVYTVAGLRGDSITPLTDLASTKSRLIAKEAGEAFTTIPDVFDTKRLLYGLTVTKMYYDNTPSNSIGASAFTSSLGSLGQSDASQQVNIVAIPNTDLNKPRIDSVKTVNDNLGTAIVNPANGVQICLKSGGTDQSGLVTIGGQYRQAVVSLKIFNNTSCS